MVGSGQLDYRDTCRLADCRADLFRSAEAVLAALQDESRHGWCQQLGHPRLFGPTRKMQRECQAHDCRRLCVRRRPAGHSSTGTPTADQESMLSPLLIDQPVQRSTPRLVQLRRRRADRAPCRTPRLLESHHGGAERRQALGQQFKINSADAAAGAMTEH